MLDRLFLPLLAVEEGVLELYGRIQLFFTKFAGCMCTLYSVYIDHIPKLINRKSSVREGLVLVYLMKITGRFLKTREVRMGSGDRKSWMEKTF